MQNNQLPTKTPLELKDNSKVLGSLALNSPFTNGRVRTSVVRDGQGYTTYILVGGPVSMPYA
jgi:hypothetical protein